MANPTTTAAPRGEYVEGLEDVFSVLTERERARLVYVLANRESRDCGHPCDGCCDRHIGAMNAVEAIFPEVAF